MPFIQIYENSRTYHHCHLPTFGQTMRYTHKADERFGVTQHGDDETETEMMMKKEIMDCWWNEEGKRENLVKHPQQPWFCPSQIQLRYRRDFKMDLRSS